MKTLCVVLLLAVSVPGCSRFSKNARMERAYARHLRKATVTRDKNLKKMTRQSAQMRSLRNTPAPPPVQQETVEPPPENQ
jgi:hypothetical protein